MNKQESFKIVKDALTEHISNSMKKNSIKANEIRSAFTNLERIDKSLEYRIEFDKSETRTIRDFLMGGHQGREYSDFPDSNLYIGTAFEVGGAYENWGFVVRRWDTVKKEFKLIATHRNLKGVIEKAIINLNKQ